jgi:hypothetical protein
LWRLVFHREQGATAELKIVVGGGAGTERLFEHLLDGRTRRQMVEIVSAARILGRAPLLDLGIVPVFQPAVVVGDFNALIFVGDGALWRCWWRGNGRALRQGYDGDQKDGDDEPGRRGEFHECAFHWVETGEPFNVLGLSLGMAHILCKPPSTLR